MARCPNCGEDSPDRFAFCPVCGTCLLARPAAAEERKVVSVLFCDLVGFTSASDNADPEDVRETLRPYHARLRTELERLGGTVEKFIGDAVMAVFGAPVAHEDDASRAVHAGFRILDAIAALNRERPGRPLHVRIGIATGEAVVSLGARVAEGEGIVTGDVVNTAARLQTLAPVDGIVVGAITHALTRDAFDYAVLDPVAVKGKAGPVARWQPTAPRSGTGADLPAPARPLVGRNDDLDVLRGAYARAVRAPGVQFVTVSGEPGVGKSRLLAEFLAEVDDPPEMVRWRRGRCLPYGEGITFWALGEVLKTEAGILDTDDEASASAKLATAVGAVVTEPADRAWLSARLAPLVGATAAESAGPTVGVNREEAFAAWRRYFHALADQRPLVLVLEDLHWADPALLAFLEDLLDDAAEVPLLLVVTGRPELYTRAPGWGGGRPNASTVRLLPLSGEDTARLLAGLLETAVLPAPVQSALVQRCGGNPLHAGELVRLLRDRGLLVGGARVLELAAGADLPLPDTVAAVIAARLDTLPPPSKSLLADAAVVGTVFWPPALAAVSGRTEADVRAGLRELTRAELIRSVRSSTVAGATEHAFWHGLTRDVAYGQLPRAARTTKHLAVADWLETLTGDRAGDRAELLAYHYGQAHHLVAAGGDAARAEALALRTAQALLVAGERALSLDAGAASAHYGRALELLPGDHHDRPRALRGRAEAVYLGGDLDQAAADLKQAIVAFRALDELAAAGDALLLLADIRWFQGHGDESRALIEQAVDVLTALPPGDELARAYAQVACSELLSGRPREGLRAAQLALGLDSATARPLALAFRGWARGELGDLDGIDDVREAIAGTDELGLSRWAAQFRGDLAAEIADRQGPSAGLAAYRSAVEFASTRGLSLLTHFFRSAIVQLLGELARWDEALAAGREAASWLQSHGSDYSLAGIRTDMAMAHLRLDQLDEAERLIAESVPAAREAGDPQLLVPALTTAALVVELRAGARAAVAHVRELESAVPHDGSFWTRSLPDLMRLAVAAGDLALARQLLQGVSALLPRHRLALDTARAASAEATGAVKEAAALYPRIAAGWHGFGIPLEEAYALLGAGRCLLRLGDPAGADQVRAARRILVELGARALVRQADHLLAETISRTS